MKLIKYCLIITFTVILFASFRSYVSAQENSDKLTINEFLPNPEGTDTDLEWVEIFNPSDSELSVLGYSLKVNDKEIFKFEEESFILPRTYSVIKLAKSPLPNCSTQPCSVKFELIKDKTVIDAVNYTQTVNGKSWSKSKEGIWVMDYELTPGVDNRKLEIIKTLQISEVYPTPESGQSEWVELLNYGDKDIDLTGWYLTDKTGKSKLEGVIPASSYLVIEDFNISLNNSDESIGLHAPDEIKVDGFAYQDTYKAASVIELGDKAVVSLTATPGKENIYTPLVTIEEEVAPKPQPKKTSNNVLGEQAVFPSINYSFPHENVHGLPQFISHQMWGFSTKGLVVYLIALAGLICWRWDYLKSYYEWWAKG